MFSDFYEDATFIERHSEEGVIYDYYKIRVPNSDYNDVIVKVSFTKDFKNNGTYELYIPNFYDLKDRSIVKIFEVFLEQPPKSKRLYLKNIILGDQICSFTLPQKTKLKEKFDIFSWDNNWGHAWDDEKKPLYLTSAKKNSLLECPYIHENVVPLENFVKIKTLPKPKEKIQKKQITPPKKDTETKEIKNSHEFFNKKKKGDKSYFVDSPFIDAKKIETQTINHLQYEFYKLPIPYTNSSVGMLKILVPQNYNIKQPPALKINNSYQLKDNQAFKVEEVYLYVHPDLPKFTVASLSINAAIEQFWLPVRLVVEENISTTKGKKQEASGFVSIFQQKMSSELQCKKIEGAINFKSNNGSVICKSLQVNSYNASNNAALNVEDKVKCESDFYATNSAINMKSLIAKNAEITNSQFVAKTAKIAEEISIKNSTVCFQGEVEAYQDLYTKNINIENNSHVKVTNNVSADEMTVSNSQFETDMIDLYYLYANEGSIIKIETSCSIWDIEMKNNYSLYINYISGVQRISSKNFGEFELKGFSFGYMNFDLSNGLVRGTEYVREFIRAYTKPENNVSFAESFK